MQLVMSKIVLFRIQHRLVNVCITGNVLQHRQQNNQHTATFKKKLPKFFIV